MSRRYDNIAHSPFVYWTEFEATLQMNDKRSEDDWIVTGAMEETQKIAVPEGSDHDGLTHVQLVII